MGRDKRNERRGEHFAQMNRAFMDSPAWRALSTSAQALYPWLKLEWHGPKANNNGEISLSVRQAAERMGVTSDTAARAFHDLQAKGFIHVMKAARLGVYGDAQSPEYELTELAPRGQVSGRRLFLEWRAGHDFPVQKANANNPHGLNKKKSHPENLDIGVINFMTAKRKPS